MLLIRDKITPELKSRFLQEIRTTIEIGKERGFFICKDEKDSLSATKSCEGKECTVNLSSLQPQCKISDNDFDIVTMELFRGIDVDKSPLEWARDLFDIEIIDLK